MRLLDPQRARTLHWWRRSHREARFWLPEIFGDSFPFCFCFTQFLGYPPKSIAYINSAIFLVLGALQAEVLATTLFQAGRKSTPGILPCVLFAPSVRLKPHVMLHTIHRLQDGQDILLILFASVHRDLHSFSVIKLMFSLDSPLSPPRSAKLLECQRRC
jgi:hypothetical protein